MAANTRPLSVGAITAEATVIKFPRFPGDRQQEQSGLLHYRLMPMHYQRLYASFYYPKFQFAAVARRGCRTRRLIGENRRGAGDRIARTRALAKKM